jgi:radical SAM superfamily enzyme YgiQ (UPF0313 family)
MRAILADLRVNELTGGEIPLGLANIASYALDALPGLETLLTVDPSELARFLEGKAPDVLMLSNYCWNKNISLRMAAYAKRLHPGCAIVMGGPNIANDAKRRAQFLKDNPSVDFHVLHDGEIPSARLLAALDRLGSTRAVKHNPEGLVSTAYMDGGDYRELPASERIASLDEIPSPYRNGLLDKFFAMRLLPKIQSARGCPYTCAYCNMGDKFHGIMPRMSVERFGSDMEAIVELMRVHGYEFRVVNLIDNNFGLFPEDVRKAEIILHLHETTGYPSMVSMYTAKVVNERVFRAASALKSMAYVSNTSQTLNPRTLAAIRRPHRGIETFKETSRRLKREGFKTQSEVISGLPLETWESFRDGVDVLDGLGFDDYIIYQLTIIDGSPMDDPVFLDRYGMEVKYRLYPNSITQFDGETIGEIEKVVVKTSTLSEEHYHDIRLFTFLLRLQTALQLPGLFGYLRQRHGLTGPALAAEVMGRVKKDPVEDNLALSLLRRFRHDAKAELLDTPGVENAPPPVNLVHAYRARILTLAFRELCEIYSDAASKLAGFGQEDKRIMSALLIAVAATDLTRFAGIEQSDPGELAEIRISSPSPDAIVSKALAGEPLDGMSLEPRWFSVPPKLREDVRAFVRLAAKGDEHLVLAYSTLTQMPFRLMEETT